MSTFVTTESKASITELRVRFGDVGDLRTAGNIFAAMDRLWTAIQRLTISYESVEGLSPADALAVRQGPHLARISLQSPLEVRLVLGALSAVPAVVGRFCYVLRNPEDAGAAVGRVVAGWHRGMGEAALAQRERIALLRRLDRMAMLEADVAAEALAAAIQSVEASAVLDTWVPDSI